MSILQNQCINLSEALPIEPEGRRTFEIRFQVIQQALADFVFCIGYRGDNPPNQLPYRLLRIVCRTEVIPGPSFKANIIRVSKKEALIRVAVPPVACDVQFVGCMLTRDDLALDTAAQFPSIVTNEKTSVVDMISCISLTHGSDANGGPNYELKQNTSSRNHNCEEHLNHDIKQFPYMSFDGKTEQTEIPWDVANFFMLNSVNIRWVSNSAIGVTSAKLHGMLVYSHSLLLSQRYCFH